MSERSLELRAREVATRAMQRGSERVLIVYDSDDRRPRAKVYGECPLGQPKKPEVLR